MQISLRRNQIYFSIFLAVLTVLLIAILANSCGNDNDGFESSQTSSTKDTLPSKTPTIEQPCSLITIETAASILGTTIEKLEKPESSQPDKETLRCRYSAISDDQKLFLVLNVYVYKTQSSYDLIEKANKGKKIETTVDEGFYFDRTNNLEIERFVAAREGKSRVAVSSSIAVVQPEDKISDFQFVLPGLDVLATQLGLILSAV